MSSSWTRSGRTVPSSGVARFQSLASAGGSKLQNGRYRITTLDRGCDVQGGTPPNRALTETEQTRLRTNRGGSRRRSWDGDHHVLPLDLHLEDRLRDLRA